MMSSEGCSARQSMYWPKKSGLPTLSIEAFIGLPASVRS
ncbi:Uncharacterised protein [Mycobacterium tuberculosis]|nr:Uncharacterised protein [Mycobacterium tuberculosis]